MRILLELFVCGLNYIACFDNIFNWSIVHDLPFKGRLLPVVSRVFTKEYKVILFPLFITCDPIIFRYAVTPQQHILSK